MTQINALCADVANRVMVALRQRYRTKLGRDDRESECCRSYSHYSVTVAVPAQGEAQLFTNRVNRAIDDLMDSIGPSTRHGLLVVRNDGATVENLTEGASTPILRLRISIACHGSSLEEWDAALKVLKEEKL